MPAQTQQQAKHTATPWKHITPHQLRNHNDEPWCPIQTNGELAFDLVAPQAMDVQELHANAQFIVTACNSHYALLEACKAVLEAVESRDLSLCPGLYDAFPFAQLEAAVAQAEG